MTNDALRFKLFWFKRFSHRQFGDHGRRGGTCGGSRQAGRNGTTSGWFFPPLKRFALGSDADIPSRAEKDGLAVLSPVVDEWDLAHHLWRDKARFPSSAGGC
jgi:hypothetical protein